MSIGTRMKERRMNKGLTQENVAKKVGVATQTIYKYEKEIVTNIPIERIYKIADALNTTTSYLLGVADDPDVNSFLGSAFETGIAEMTNEERKKERNTARAKAEKEHLKILYEICNGETNTESVRKNVVNKLYNQEFLPIRISMVTEFIKSNKELLQNSMPGITILDKESKENEEE